MGYLVDYLEQRGYLERRPDPNDRRVALICLTDRGWDEIRAALSIIAAIEAGWARRIGKRRMHQLRDILTELAATPDRPGARGFDQASRVTDAAPSSAISSSE
jgi:DNA-binding MarR family transcriptional regulator